MQYAVITGATQGIGKAVTEKLLKEGYSIAVCARSKEQLTTLQGQWQQQYPAATIMIFNTDLGVKSNVLDFANAVLNKFPKVDILVNNTGAFTPGEIADEPDGKLENLIAVNLYSAYYLTRGLLPQMKQNRKGHIFNMCSVASLKAYPNGGSYSISKYALLGFSDNLREELRPFNIKVTSICPGATYTPSWEGSGVPQDRIMEAADVANMLYSASNLSPQANVENIIMRPVKGDL
jgi:short-subunit dehydrogenase